jgi:hypothetical protein
MQWTVEIVTDDTTCNLIEMEAGAIVRLDWRTLAVDGIAWELPVIAGLSFGEVRRVDERE